MQMFARIKLAFRQLCSSFKKHKVSEYCIMYKLFFTYSQTASQHELRVFYTDHLQRHNTCLEGSESLEDCLDWVLLEAAPEQKQCISLLPLAAYPKPHLISPLTSHR